MKGQTMLKVTSILMLIGGILGAILSVVALIGVAALVALLGGGGGLLYASSILAVVSAVAQIIAAAKGLGASKAPEKAASCLPWGIIVAAFCVIAQILSVAGGNGFSVVSLLIGLVLPVLYIIGVVQMKGAAV